MDGSFGRHSLREVTPPGLYRVGAPPIIVSLVAFHRFANIPDFGDRPYPQFFRLAPVQHHELG